MRRVVITGTGTEIGKTYVACALLRASAVAQPGIRAAGLKPVESGVSGAVGPDAAALRGASTFHVKQSPPYVFADAVSPHLAARRTGRTIDLRDVVAWADAATRDLDLQLIELPGALFSPLGPRETNFELLRALEPTRVLVVAPDRLGVLHEVECLRRAVGDLTMDAIILNAPALPDASSGTNAEELRRLQRIPVVGPLPRRPLTTDELRELARTLTL